MNFVVKRKKEAADRRIFSYRLNLFFLSAFIVFTSLILRLAILQFVEGPTLSLQEARSNAKQVSLSPVRGTIYDATGKVKLAYSEPVHSLYLTLYQNYKQEKEASNPYRAEAEQIAQSLHRAFLKYGNQTESVMTKEQILERMDLNYRLYHGFVPRLIKSKLSEEEIAHFLEHKQKYKGIEIREESIRCYDPDGVAVQAIGYLRKFKSCRRLKKYEKINSTTYEQQVAGFVHGENELVGVDGLEQQYQEELRGKSGYNSVAVNPRNLPEEIVSVMEPEKGYDIVSTIHKDIQLQAQQAITEQLRYIQSNRIDGKYHPNAKTGFAVAMEVNTGNVVCMASMPNYDPNIWRNGSLSTEQFRDIQYIYQNGTIRAFAPDSSRGRVESVVLLGSVVKPLSVLIGMQESFFAPNTLYLDKGIAYLGKDQRGIRNAHHKVFGQIDAITALQKSSNAFMIDLIGKKMYQFYGDKSVERWDSYMKQFGLGVATGVDLPNEYLGYLDYKRSNESSLTKLAFASFGQQAKYTTMQLVQYAATIANKGRRIQPHMVKEIIDCKGEIIKKFQPKILNEIKFHDEYWDVICKGMTSKVLGFDGFKYDFVRKTGTSEQQLCKKIVENGVFISYAPATKPKLAIAIVIPEGGFGGSSAAPIARKIYDAYDKVYGLDEKFSK